VNNYRIELIDSTESFTKKKDEWLLFESTLNNVSIFNSYNFLFLFWILIEKTVDHKFGYKKKLQLIFLYNDKELLAILPLCLLSRKRKKIIIVKYLEFLGQQFFTSYMDIISKNLEKESFEFIHKWIKKNISYDIINLELLTEHSNLAKYLNHSWMYEYNYSPEIIISNFTSYEEFKTERLSGNYRGMINNSYNKLKKDQYNFETIRKKFDDTDLDLIYPISKSKLIDGKYNIYDDANKREFARKIYELFNAEISYIKLNNRIVSYQIYIYYREQSMWFDISFDREFAKYRPGILQYDIGLSNSFKNNIKRNILGYGNDQNKIGICTHKYILYNYIEKGNTILSSFWYKEKVKVATLLEKQLLENEKN
jgi:hypothetical protein